jgi:hypothetical protein
MQISSTSGARLYAKLGHGLGAEAQATARAPSNELTELAGALAGHWKGAAADDALANVKDVAGKRQIVRAVRGVSRAVPGSREGLSSDRSRT